LFKDFRGAEGMVEIVDTHEPDPTAHAEYGKLYDVFQSAYAALVPVFERMANLQGPAPHRLCGAVVDRTRPLGERPNRLHCAEVVI